MRQALVVLNSNRVNRYNMVFPVSTLESALDQTWELGRPTCISHDMHRPAAWTNGLSLYLEPGLARLTGVVTNPETEQESKELSKHHVWHLSNRLWEQVEPYKEEFKRGIGSSMTGEERPGTMGCAALVGPQLAVRVFPELFALRDERDGLVPLKELTPVGPGVFTKNGLLLFAHPFFRRSLSRLNSLNEPFLSLLQEQIQNPDLTVKIALDENMLGLASTYVKTIELEYWYGPKFNDDLSTINLGPAHNLASPAQKLYYGISSTEFWWYVQDERKTFECEELRDRDSLGVGQGRFGCRYVHSMLDKRTSVPEHLDGAIRLYNEEMMLERLDQKLHTGGRHTEYTKLWRIDGPISVGVWKELITHYYRDNHLVGEYFGEKDAPPEVEPIFLQQTAYPLRLYLPTDMTANQGIRLSVSYHERSKGAGDVRRIRSMDRLRDGSPYAEYDVVDLLKILHTSGETVELPKSLRLVAIEDLVHNFPVITHTGPSAVDLANRTAAGLRTLVDAWRTRKDDRLVSYTLAVQYDDRDAHFSVAGHVEDVCRWLNSAQSQLPPDRHGLPGWCETAYNWISQSAPHSEDTPELSNLLKLSGALRFERHFLSPEQYHTWWDEQKGAIVGELRIPRAPAVLGEALVAGHLKVAPAFWVKRSSCTRCNEEYKRCGCGKYLEEGVIQQMDSVQLMGYCLTNRKA